MATELEHGSLFDRTAATGLRGYSALRANLAASRALLIRRRRDLRFRVLPYDLFMVVNAGAVILTLFLILLFAFDPLLVAWQAMLPRRVVALFGFITRFGKSDWILISTGLFLILMLALDATALRARFRVRRAVRSLAAFYVFASVAISGIVANISKHIVGRARPKLFAEDGSFSFDFWSGSADWGSFPSGHATTGMALGLALALLFPRFRWVFLSLGFWIAVSRLFIRAHYPSDVLAGGLLGALAAWLIARALARRRLIFGFDDAGRLTRRNGASGRLT